MQTAIDIKIMFLYNRLLNKKERKIAYSLHWAAIFYGGGILVSQPAQENKMGVMPENRLLLNMALPMIVSMLIQACYNVVDLSLIHI